MTGNVSGPKPVVPGTNETVSIQNKIKMLEQQKRVLKNEMERVKNNGSIDKKTADTRIMALKKQIDQIEKKIDQLKKKLNQKTVKQQKVSPAGKTQIDNTDRSIRELSNDIYEKSDDNDRWDNTYRIVRDTGKIRIKYARPKG